jgi:hypothetical protein
MKTIQHLDMSSFMEAYTAKINAEHARAQAIREGRIPAPQAQWTEWKISDRH